MSSSAKRKRHDLHRSDDGRPTKKSESQLYVGNLDRTVTEYHMVQLMKPYGKVVMQEFMWHKSGPNRGMPRGYCFVEYATKAEAERAKKALHQKLFRGRPLVVQLTTERVQFYRDSDAAQGHMKVDCAQEATEGDKTVEEVGLAISSSMEAIKAKLRELDNAGKKQKK